MNNKLSDKDKKDWQNFTLSKDKVLDKDNKKNVNKKEKKLEVDLHGFSLDGANKFMEKFINNSYENEVKKIVVITGKGNRSKTEFNPYLSKDLSILRYSVPEFIKFNLDLMKKIKYISDAEIKDGGSGAFYIYLKSN